MTSEETLYTGTVTNIAALIGSCDFQPEAFVLVERGPRIVIDDQRERRDLLRLAEKHGDEENGWRYYLFGERLEEDKLSRMSIEPEEGYAYYAETRVPRLLLYPEIKDKDGKLPKRLQVSVREYRLIFTDPKTQQKREEGRTYRFVNLVKAREEEKEE